MHDAPLPGDGNWILAASPRYLRYASSPPVEADTALAIEHYQAVAEAAIDPTSRAEAQRRAAYLRVRRADASGEFEDLDRAITAYERLLNRQPDDPGNDLAWYQLARAYQLNGDVEQSLAALRTVAYRYPDSDRHDDAVFRLAELEFSQGHYARAAADYRSVLAAGTNGRFYATARYKLGWAEYRNERYGQAIATFGEILDEELGASVPHQPEVVLATLAPGREPWVRDALRVTSLSLAELGGAAGIEQIYAGAQDEPRYAPLLYTVLAELLLEKERYSDAALALSTFVRRHPQNTLAPVFHRREIAIHRQAGFVANAVESMGRFVENYAPDAPYWGSAPLDAGVVATGREYLLALGRHHHAHFQQRAPIAVAAAAGADELRIATSWYRRFLDLFPADREAAATEFLLAEACDQLNQSQAAANHFLAAAYDYPGFERAGEAAYAAVLMYQKLTGAAQSQEQKRQWRQHAIASSLRLADSFRSHPQWSAVMLRAVEDLTLMQSHAQAANVAERILGNAETNPATRRLATTLLGDARLAEGAFAAAEDAFAALLEAYPDDTKIAESLAVAIYRQAESDLAQGSVPVAVDHYLRLARRLPDSALSVDALYNAAAALLGVRDYAAAEPVLEEMLWRHPDHPLTPEARRRLAVVYENLGKPVLAATTYAAIAADDSMEQSLRRAASWRSAELLDEANDPHAALSAYADYVRAYPEPLDAALKARNRLAALSRVALGDLQAYRHWLEALVEAEQQAGGARDDHSQWQSAQAALALGHLQATRARAVAIAPPIERAIVQRTQQTERALTWLRRAADAGFEDLVPAATFAMATAYADLAQALVNPQLAAGMALEEADALLILLEEQAFPFEEKAIALHEANLQLLQRNVWGPWIHRSTMALAEFVPAKYAKREQLKDYNDDNS